MQQLSVTEARRIVLAAQGFDRPRPAGRAGARQIRTVLDRIGLLQLDSVNVLCRSHYLPLYARLGDYSRRTLDRMAYGPSRELFEYWGHQASLIPIHLQPLLRWRMDAARAWTWDWSPTDRPGEIPADWSNRWDRRIQAPWAVIAGMTRLAAERPVAVDDARTAVAERGPITAAEAGTSPRRQRGQPDPDPSTGRMWNWQDGKIAVEWLFCAGEVGVADRVDFTRRYDLSERIIPAAIRERPTPSEPDAVRELVRRSARALGVGTEKQLRDYFLLPAELTRTAVGELVDADELIKTRVQDSAGVRYRWHRAEPRELPPIRTLLSPFDSLIWFRDRIEQLFGFRYRTSIYTKAADRKHGYYVLPFLLGEEFVARVDLKADRQDATLRVPTVTLEPGAEPELVADELAAELRTMAGWLDLERVEVCGRGDLAAPLARALG